MPGTTNTIRHDVSIRENMIQYPNTTADVDTRPTAHLSL
jgi:hypothetical protein